MQPHVFQYLKGKNDVGGRQQKLKISLTEQNIEVVSELARTISTSHSETFSSSFRYSIYSLQTM